MAECEPWTQLVSVGWLAIGAAAVYTLYVTRQNALMTCVMAETARVACHVIEVVAQLERERRRA